MPHQYSISEIHNWNDYNHFGIHAEPSLLLFLPIYAIFPSVYTILIVQAAALGMAAIPLYKFVKTVSSTSTASILALAYLLYPTTILSTRFFYPISFLPILLFTMLYAYQKERTLLFATAFILALGLKETIPFLTAPLGIILLHDQYFDEVLSSKSPWKTKAATFTLLISIVWFFFALLVFIPAFSAPGSTSDLTTRYSYLGDSLTAIMVNAITNPKIVLTKLLTLHTGKYVLTVIFPLAAVPLRTSKSIVLCLPIFMQNALSTKHLQHTLYYHYQFMFLIGMLIAAVITLQNINPTQRKKWLGAIGVSSIIFVVIYLGYFTWLVATGAHI